MTEDDTFIALRRSTFEQLYSEVISHDRILTTSELYEVIAWHGWTWQEYLQAYRDAPISVLTKPYNK